MHPGESGPGTGQLAGCRAEAQQQPVVGYFPAVCEFHLPRGGIQPHGFFAQSEFDSMFVVKSAVPEQQALSRHLSRQVFLRQRRTLIRQIRLIADQHQAAAEALPPQGIDCLRAGLAAAYDDYGREHRIPFITARDRP